MAPPSGAASYKKKDGTLTLTDDEQTLTWSPAAAGVSTLTLPVSKITSMQRSCFMLRSVMSLNVANKFEYSRSAADPSWESESDAEDICFSRKCTPEYST